MNMACGRKYKQEKNHKRACRCHPGKWDFGYSGLTVSKAMRMSSEDALWQPHWTCCRQGWESNGCTKTYHRGPLLEDYVKAPPKYEWPDWRVQTFFKKVISYAWKEKLES